MVIREHICRGKWKNARRPILINNWEATYFNFTGEKLIEIAKQAKSLGIELFAMDDGWFGNRQDDSTGLGDWFPNEEKLGCTLKELAERITAEGMQFGIWLEPFGCRDALLYAAAMGQRYDRCDREAEYPVRGFLWISGFCHRDSCFDGSVAMAGTFGYELDIRLDTAWRILPDIQSA